jgi:hypothetical protein
VKPFAASTLLWDDIVGLGRWREGRRRCREQRGEDSMWIG